MATEKDVKIRISSDVSGAQRGFSTLKTGFTELNQGLELAKKGFGALGSAVTTFTEAVNLGDQLDDLSGAFDRLYGSTTTFAGDGVGKLSAALRGLVSQVDILKGANLAAQNGLDPKLFLDIASSAKSLGDAVGKDAKEAFEDLTKAFATGSPKLLEFYGIQLKGIPASQQLASAWAQMNEKAGEAGESADSAADRMQQLLTTFSDTKAAVGSWLNNSDLITESLAEIVKWADSAALAIKRVLGQVDPLDEVNMQIVEANQAILDATRQTFTDEDFQEFVAGMRAKIQGLIKKRDELFEEESKKAKPKKFGNDPFAGGIDEAGKKLDELKKKWGEFKRGIAQDSLSKSLEKAIKEGDQSAFAALKEQFQKSTSEGLEEAFKEITDPNKQRYFQAATELASLDYEEKMSEANKKIAEDIQKELEDKFQKSVDFFADVFENAITGTTFNLEDALKRLAVGFASQLAASIAASLGFDFSGVSGLSGLGSAIGSSLAGAFGLPTTGSGIGGIVSGLFGAGAGALAGGALAPAAPTLISATAGVGGGAVAGTSVAGASLAATLGTAAIAGLVAVALPFALSGATKFFGKIFGGSQDPDELARRAFRKELSKTGLGEDLILPTVQGDVKLSQIDYKKFSQTFAGKDFGDQALGLVAPFSQVLTGGGKLGEDFALIFAQAVGNAKNYNEVIINTLSLMSKLGVSAGEAKDQFKELFLDGKVTLDQFTVGVQNLNFIAQEDLVGPNSVADALSALATAVDNPRIQLKALELAFKEMSQLGITKSNDIYQYLMEKFGPSVAEVFKALTDAGIDTWEEIKNASVDQLVLIFNALKSFSIDADATMARVAKQVTTVFADSGTKAATEFDKATQPIIRRIKEIGDEAVKTGGVLDAAIKNLNDSLAQADTKVGEIKTKAGGITGSVPNNEFRA